MTQTHLGRGWTASETLCPRPRPHALSQARGCQPVMHMPVGVVAPRGEQGCQGPPEEVPHVGEGRRPRTSAPTPHRAQQPPPGCPQPWSDTSTTPCPRRQWTWPAPRPRRQGGRRTARPLLPSRLRVPRLRVPAPPEARPAAPAGEAGGSRRAHGEVAPRFLVTGQTEIPCGVAAKSRTVGAFPGICSLPAVHSPWQSGGVHA